MSDRGAVSTQILDALSADEAAPSRLRDIADTVGKSIEQTGAMLFFLMGRDQVRRVGKGHYVKVESHT